MTNKSFQPSIDAAKSLWPLSAWQISQLTSVCKDLGLSVPSGDLILLDGKWYVTHAGLLRLATRNHCAGIWVTPVKVFSDPENNSWTFKARVFKSPGCKGFDGYGDACPANVSELVRGAEMRMAETRAVNRALRKAYGVPLCSMEEIGRGDVPESASSCKIPPQSANVFATNGRLGDQLSEAIRRHQLDAKLVKAYAADFCGIGNLREADRETVTRFVQNLRNWATRDRSGLLAHLECYKQNNKEAA
jgi:hypothetical protein